MTWKSWRFWLPMSQSIFLSGIMGWLIADFQLPHWMVVISLGLMAHLCWAGADAIFLAVVWLMILLWIGVIQFSWPVSLRPHNLSFQMIAWTLNLGATWLISMMFMFSLARNQRLLIQSGCDRSFTCQILVLLTWLSFAIGWMINQSGQIPLRVVSHGSLNSLLS